MSKVSKYVIAPPTPLGLSLASTIHDRYVFLPGGRKLVISALQELLELPEKPLELLILLTDISSAEEVRPHLRKLTASGTRINWCTGYQSERVEHLCRKMAAVNVFSGSSLQSSFSSQYFPHDNPPIFADLAKGNSDLEDFLRHKISLSFMCALEVTPLHEGIEKVAHFYGRHPKKSFSLSHLSPEEKNSVENFRQADFPYLEGKSKAIVALKERISSVGRTDLGVLIVGQTGTGKESVAYYLHEFSQRRNAPFLSINCAGLDETFLRSELFGHEKGAFTGAVNAKAGLVEEAAGGTLFLDELPDLAPSLQADLLRFLQSKRYRRLGGTEVHQADIRVIAAAQPGLVKRVRPDLFYRIAEVTVETPSLSQIPNDIMRVVSHLVFRFTKGRTVKMGPSVSEVLAYFREGEEILRLHDWQGNVRQLAGLVKRRVLLGDDVLAEISQSEGKSQKARTPLAENNIRPIDDVIRDYVRSVHETFPQLSKQALAKAMGKSVNTLRKYLQSGESDD